MTHLKKQLAIIAVFALSLMFFVKCTDNTKLSNEKNDIENLSILEESNPFEDMFVLPPQTEISLSNETFSFKLPDGYLMIAQVYDESTNSLKIMEIIDGSITCTCTSGSGCNPYTGPSGSGCNMTENCSSCDKTTTTANGTYDLIDAQVLNFKENDRFLSDEKDRIGLPNPKYFIFESPKVMQRISNLLSGYNNEKDGEILKNADINDLPEEYGIVKIRFLGTLLAAPLNTQTSISAKLSLAYKMASPDDYSCTCSSGGSGCTLNSKSVPFYGTIYWCESGSCTACTLNF